MYIFDSYAWPCNGKTQPAALLALSVSEAGMMQMPPMCPDMSPPQYCAVMALAVDADLFTLELRIAIS